MKIDIGNKNKIKNSNIGKYNKITKDEKNYVLEILIGIAVTVIGGIILYFITK